MSKIFILRPNYYSDSAQVLRSLFDRTLCKVFIIKNLKSNNNSVWILLIKFNNWLEINWKFL